MKLIKFIPWSKVIKETTPHPVKTSVPQWWRDGETTFESKFHSHADGTPHEGMKMCVPFMEIMMTGYTLLTPFDIYVTKTESGDTSIKWHGPEIVEENQVQFIGHRPPELGATIPRPAGHSKVSYTWFSYWSWKTPRGYSTFVTHPFNRHDLPFTTLNGIVDSDKFHLNGNIPFYLKADFEGIIPAGTPFAQIYPFKRISWKMWVDDTFNEDILEKQGKPLRLPGGGYKKKMWSKKEFE
jgi:hypothetical protein